MGSVPSGSRPAATLAAQHELAEETELGDGIYPTIDAAVAAAQRAQVSYAAMGLGARHDVIASVRRSMTEHAESLAMLAHTETGLGRYEDKIKKNRLVINKTPGPEDLEPQAVTGDAGMSVTEWAPLGLVGAITPTTNPTSTIINNSIAISRAATPSCSTCIPEPRRCRRRTSGCSTRRSWRRRAPDLVTAIPRPRSTAPRSSWPTRTSGSCW